MTESFKGFGRASGAMVALAIVLVTALLAPAAAWRSSPSRLHRPHRPRRSARRGGEANLVLPDLDQVDVGGYNGRTLLHDRPGRLARSACSSGWSSSTS